MSATWHLVSVSEKKKEGGEHLPWMARSLCVTTNDDIVVVIRCLVATSLSATWHLHPPPSFPFHCDVALVICCGGCFWSLDGRRWAVMGDNGRQWTTMVVVGVKEECLVKKYTHTPTRVSPKWVGEGFRRAFRGIHIHEFTVYSTSAR